MKQSLRVPVTAVFVAAILAAGSGNGLASGKPAAPAPVVTTTAPAATGGSGGGKTVVALPADFPVTAVPLPDGTITAVAGASPRWGVLQVMAGPADLVQAQVMSFYLAQGFTQDSVNSVTKDGYVVAFLASNRDHFAAKSNVTLVAAAP